jgi:DUF4097 and DUF4098 domain-containing protein YvlB
MTISRALATVLTVAAMAAAAPPMLAQGGGTTQEPGGDRGAEVRARRDELQRRREAVRQRQDELRRARQVVRRGPMASEPFTAVARIGREGTLNLVNPAGNVTITGSGGNDVRVEAVKRAWDRSDAEARTALRDITIDVAERQGAVDIRTIFERSRRIDSEVDYTIAVPSGAAVSVRTASGGVTITGVRGELSVEALGGDIKATSVGQVRLLRTLSGDVSAENVEGNDVTVSTLGGTMNIRQLKARSADLRTVSGDLVVAESEAERVMAQSLSGRVELVGRLVRTGRYSLQSQTGSVVLIPTGGDDFELEAATVNGTVRSDFPITVDDRRDLTGASGRGRGAGRGTGRGAGRGVGRGSGARILRGMSGDGGALVTLRSFTGDITITRR